MANKIKKKIGVYIQLIRPFTLIPPAVAVISGGLLALGFYGRLSLHSLFQPGIDINFVPLIVGAFMYGMLNGASNAYNQIYDLDIDKINRPDRPLPSGKLTVNEALGFAFVVYAIGLLIAFAISPSFFIVTALCLIITTIYSTPPIWLKKRLIVSNMTIAFCQSCLFLLAGWVIFPFANPFEPTLWFIGIFLFIYLIGACGTKDFTEVEGDRKFGIKTLPVLYGNDKAARITGMFFIFPFLLIPLGVISGILIFNAIYITMFIIYGAYIDITLATGNLYRPRKRKENSPAWVHYYIRLMALQLGFLTVYLICVNSGAKLSFELVTTTNNALLPALSIIIRDLSSSTKTFSSSPLSSEIAVSAEPNRIADMATKVSKCTPGGASPAMCIPLLETTTELATFGLLFSSDNVSLTRALSAITIPTPNRVCPYYLNP
jgi:4-hydroxybenzoate polyprenyltransferase